MEKVKKSLRASDPGDRNFTMFESPYYWLIRVTHRYSQRMDAVLKRMGMDVARQRVLMILTEIEPASVSLLAEHGVIKLFTMTKTVQRLEAEGLVSTRQKASDARVTEVMLTRKGREAVAKIRLQTSQIYHEALDGISLERQQTLLTILRHMSENLDRQT